MRNATKVTVSTFGVLAALAGLEHGIGEVLQGNRAPDGMMIVSWPESAFFRIVAGEPAMTVVPNLLVTGILAMIVSLVFLVWVTMFVQRKHGGLVLILLSLLMLLVGGGLKGFHLTNGGGQDATLWYDHACQDLIAQRRIPCPPHQCMIPRASS